MTWTPSKTQLEDAANAGGCVMLTKKQALSLAKQHGMIYGVRILPDSPLFNNTKNLVDFANTLYAAGAKDMRERCEKVCEEQMQFNECPERAQYCADAIRALEVT